MFLVHLNNNDVKEVHKSKTKCEHLLKFKHVINYSLWTNSSIEAWKLRYHIFPAASRQCEYLVAVRQRLLEAGGSTAIVSSEQLQLGQIEKVGDTATTVRPQQLLGQNLLRHLTTGKQ